MAKDKVQTEPGSAEAPQPSGDKGGLKGKSSIELLALAGDENARRALGQPTAGDALGGRRELDGFTVGQAAERDVFISADGSVSESAEADGDEPFRGTHAIVKGTTVTSAALAAYAAAKG